MTAGCLAWRARAVPAGALVAFGVLAALLFAGTWVHPGAAWVGANHDPHLFIWYLGWVPRQLVSGHSPLFTTDLDYPSGANLMWNTAVFLPATMLWPVTAAFGPVVSYNVLVTAAVALSAWSAFLAVRRLVASDLLAAIAGLLYGFSPYMVAQSAFHPHVTLAVFPPVALILLHELLVRQRRSPLLAGGLLGVASAAQLLTAEEVLATTVLVAAGGVALLALLHPRRVAGHARRALTGLAASVVCFGVLAAYPILFQFFGPRRVSGVLQTPNVYVSDVLAFVVPPHAVWFSTRASVAVTSTFTGNPAENDAYLGVPLIALLGAAAILCRRQPVARWAALFTIGVAVLSLGPQLHVGGRLTAVPLPWALVQKLPLMQNVVPARLMLFAFLGAGVLLAELGAAAVAAGPRRGAIAAGAVLVALVPLIPRLPYPSTPAQAPAFFHPGGGVAEASHRGAVLVTPYSNSHSSSAMYWQATADYAFRMPEGEVFVPGPTLGPPPSYLQTSLMELDRGRTVPASPADRARALRELSELGVDTIVAGPSPGHDLIVGYFTSILGRPPVRTQGVDVWWNVNGAG